MIPFLRVRFLFSLFQGSPVYVALHYFILTQTRDLPSVHALFFAVDPEAEACEATTMCKTIGVELLCGRDSRQA